MLDRMRTLHPLRANIAPRAVHGKKGADDPQGISSLGRLSKQFAIGSEKRMRPVKAPDRNLMGNDTAKSLPWKPGMEMECWRLRLERRLTQLGQIEVDRMIWRRTDRRR